MANKDYFEFAERQIDDSGSTGGSITVKSFVAYGVSDISSSASDAMTEAMQRLRVDVTTHLAELTERTDVLHTDWISISHQMTPLNQTPDFQASYIGSVAAIIEITEVSSGI